jgi:hypothetical protein
VGPVTEGFVSGLPAATQRDNFAPGKVEGIPLGILDHKIAGHLERPIVVAQNLNFTHLLFLLESPCRPYLGGSIESRVV